MLTLVRARASQGKHTIPKKVERHGKQKRQPKGDQQNLRKGAHLDIKAKIGKKQTEERAQKELTKRIAARIESTMAARASTDGGGLHMLKAEGAEFKELRAGASVVAQRLAKSKR